MKYSATEISVVTGVGRRVFSLLSLPLSSSLTLDTIKSTKHKTHEYWNKESVLLAFWLLMQFHIVELQISSSWIKLLANREANAWRQTTEAFC